MNHKLRMQVHVDIDPGHITLDVAGCLTQINFPVLLHILRKAQRVAVQPRVDLDLRHARHVDPGILDILRELAGQQVQPSVDAASAANLSGPLPVTLLEPALLPVCAGHGVAGGVHPAGIDLVRSRLTAGSAS